MTSAEYTEEEEEALDRHRSMTYLQGECSYRRAEYTEEEEDALSRHRAALDAAPVPAPHHVAPPAGAGAGACGVTLKLPVGD